MPRGTTYKWFPWEDEYIKENFESKTNAEIAKYLGRTACGIHMRVSRLGLKRSYDVVRELQLKTCAVRSQWQKENRPYRPIETEGKLTRAHHIVQHAARRGELLQQPCVVCGFDDTHAHHDNYNKPLEVIWLCASHHKRLHNMYKRGYITEEALTILIKEHKAHGNV